jgi:hypothetical protein
MTQISLKLFNKLPFTRNEIEGLSRAGSASMSFHPRGRSGSSSSKLKIRRPRAPRATGARKTKARGQVVLSQR